MSAGYVHLDMESSFLGNRGLQFFFGVSYVCFFGVSYVCFVLIMLTSYFTTLRRFIMKLDQTYDYHIWFKLETQAEFLILFPLLKQPRVKTYFCTLTNLKELASTKILTMVQFLVRSAYLNLDTQC